MESHQVDSSSSLTTTASGIPHPDTQHGDPTQDKSSILSASGLSSWARRFRNPQQSEQEDPKTGNAVMSTFARFNSGLRSRLSSKNSAQDESANNPTDTQSGAVASLTKGLKDSSLNAVKAVQVKARQVVSKNKRRYQVICES